ncbi:MAG: 5'-nucleotidase C-terminal domain-containing protein [Cryobacterium sp.]|uniref:bifunctional metallophosphatase/5'-nucleotidase n=1 Tax=Cryobacterium sp. TaxID=1926290 RepID=UPI001A2A8608|nr:MULTISPECIES: 5'-nucleotidase C-terminal domain-containing protein [unclassified Cryobacterium]MCY7405106.1 5'-nucleotidase C-terminal domain-containing protein [Cryobacterium sp.]MEC5155245.1 2',3'-cyclic-nucleotide 2'-phosphodiesterase/3'-nucleotidase [Cryobacterium sp. CAN_C3]
MPIQLTRRTVLGSFAAVSVLTAAGMTPAQAAERGGRHRPGDSVSLTIMGTTDLHGCVFNWNYFQNAQYDDSGRNDIGLAKVATLVEAVRLQRGRENTLMIDAGDTIQGTPLAYYFARIAPITGGHLHPMAAAMNYIGYDAAALGNHEFNYGIPLLRTFADQLDFPLLGANALDAATGLPAFAPYVIKTIKPAGEKPIKVGILGLTNPGIAIWDKANVEGQLTFPGLVEQAGVWVPRMRAAGADVVVVAAHSGATNSSSYGDALPYPENAATLVAEQVPGIDAILVGHAHQEIPERRVVNSQTGRTVILTEPLRWGMRLSLIELSLVKRNGRWAVESVGSSVLNSNTVPEDPQVIDLLGADHDTVIGYVNSVIGSCTEAMSCATARYEDSAALDFINLVQGQAVRAAIAGTPQAGLPILSIAAPFNREAAIPAGEVTVRDVAGLYIFDNTLLGITLTGAEVKAYLEKSARYFTQVTGTGPFTADQLTNAVTAVAPTGTPDYNYDVMGGLDAPLSYKIDVARDPGSRIIDLNYNGDPIDPTAQFVVAINNYRQSGGGAFPGVTAAPVVHNAQQEIRQLIIDWVTRAKAVEPPSFARVDWTLVSGGAPVQISG